jgi:hypothetical protein
MPRKTLADTLAARETVYVNCGHPMCCKSTKLDIQALIDRLGSDHGSMHRDLVGLFGCSKCKAEGRDRRPVFFTFIPDDKGQQRERNRTWKPTFESEGLRNAGTFHPRAALCACPKPCNHPYCQRVAQIGTSTVKSPWKPHLQPW